MENASLSGDVWNDVTTSRVEDGIIQSNLIYFRALVLKIIYIIIGTVGVLDNLFVVIVFIFFIKISDKVRQATVDL